MKRVDDAKRVQIMPELKLLGVLQGSLLCSDAPAEVPGPTAA